MVLTLLIVALVVGVLVAVGMFGLTLMKAGSNRERAWNKIREVMTDQEAIG